MGTKTLRASTLSRAEGAIAGGFWYEVLLYPSAHTAVPHVSRLSMLDTAWRAVRTLRCDLRAGHVLALDARESRRAISWADTGHVPALGTLARGESVTFTLMLHDGRTAQWCIRPALFLQLTAHNWCDGPGHSNTP